MFAAKALTARVAFELQTVQGSGCATRPGCRHWTILGLASHVTLVVSPPAVAAVTGPRALQSVSQSLHRRSEAVNGLKDEGEVVQEGVNRNTQDPGLSSFPLHMQDVVGHPQLFADATFTWLPVRGEAVMCDLRLQVGWKRNVQLKAELGLHGGRCPSSSCGLETGPGPRGAGGGRGEERPLPSKEGS